jgi:hypothetical protein
MMGSILLPIFVYLTKEIIMEPTKTELLEELVAQYSRQYYWFTVYLMSWMFSVIVLNDVIKNGTGIKVLTILYLLTIWYNYRKTLKIKDQIRLIDYPALKA